MADGPSTTWSQSVWNNIGRKLPSSGQAVQQISNTLAYAGRVALTTVDSSYVSASNKLAKQFTDTRGEPQRRASVESTLRGAGLPRKWLDWLGLVATATTCQMRVMDQHQREEVLGMEKDFSDNLESHILCYELDSSKCGQTVSAKSVKGCTNSGACVAFCREHCCAGCKKQAEEDDAETYAEQYEEVQSGFDSEDEARVLTR